MRSGARGLLVLCTLLATAFVMTTPASARVGAGKVASDSSGATANSSRCVAYATGQGMGSYCVSAGGGDAASLQERFGNLKQDFDNCRYEPPPAGTQAPFNPDPEKGKWWLSTCLYGIDWESFDGNPSVSIYFVWLENDFDTTYQETGLSEFLWRQVRATTQFPVPFTNLEPTPTPRVGVPAFFTFSWIDPKTNKALSQGEYSDNPRGGPFVRVDNGVMEMEARASNITVDPQQEGMNDVDCGEGNPGYDLTIPAEKYKTQDSDCYLIFNRSSAVAREKSTVDIRGSLGDVYLAEVTVTWDVRYRERDGEWQRLGDGFDMVASQPIRVREVQGNNVPPRLEIR